MRAAGHRAPCHSLGWQELDSFGLGSVGRTDGQEFGTASKSAKQQRLPSFPVSAEATAPTGPSQLQRPKPGDHDNLARTVPCPAHCGSQEDKQVQVFLPAVRVTPKWSCPPGSDFSAQGEQAL